MMGTDRVRSKIKSCILLLAVLIGGKVNVAHADTPAIKFIGNEDKNFSNLVNNSISTLLLFSKTHLLKIERSADFVAEVILYGTKESFDKMVSNSSDWPKGTKVPSTYVGLGQKRKFHVISWDAYKTIHPNDSALEYQKLITHELTHLLHIAYLKGREDDMGPMWFFEGFACFVADQYPNSPMPSKENLNEILSDKKRASYMDYVAVFRSLAKKKSVTKLLQEASSKDFSSWAKNALVEKEVSP